MDTKRVLIVEDDPSVRNIASFIASGLGLSVLQAKDALEALELVPKADVVLLDYVLPHVGGAEVVKSIRQDGNYIPVVMMSAGKDKEFIMEELRQYKVLDFISKPFKSEEVQEKLRKAVKFAEDLTYVGRATEWIRGFIERQA